MKQHSRNVRVWLLVLAVLLGAFYSGAEAQQRPWAEAPPIPGADAACYFVGRAFLNTSGQGQVVGYFTHINGIGAAAMLFIGSPPTSFFAFRSNLELGEVTTAL